VKTHVDQLGFDAFGKQILDGSFFLGVLLVL
jgi:hypothetical protein